MSDSHDRSTFSVEEARAEFKRALETGDLQRIDEIILYLARQPGADEQCLSLIMRSSMSRRRGDRAEAAEQGQLALQMAQAHQLPGMEGAALTLLAALDSAGLDDAAALEKLDTARRLLEDAKDWPQWWSAVHDKAVILLKQGDLVSAQKLAHQLLEVAQSHHLIDEEINALLLLGITVMNTESDARSIEVLQRALELAVTHRLPGTVANIHVNLGNGFGRLGDNVMAIEYYLKAAEYYQQVGETSQLSSVYLNIGASHADIDDNVSAIRYYERTLEACDRGFNEELRGLTHMNIGVARLGLNDLDGALKDLQTAERLSIELDRYDTLIHTRSNIVQVLFQQERYEEVRQYLGILVDSDFVDPFYLIDLRLYRAQLARHDNEFEKAEVYLMEALHLAKDRGLMRALIDVLTELAALRRAAGDLERYIETLDEVQQLDKEFRGVERMRQITALERQREVEQQQRELEKHRAALNATLPKHVAERVLNGEQVADTVDNACVLFLDIAGFTSLSSTIPPGHVVHLLEAIFSACDDVIHQHDLTKVKTIGDSYMAVAGVVEDTPDPVGRAASAALDLMEAMNTLQVTMPPELGDPSWVESIPELKVRIGIDYGPVVAGIVGKDRLQYDVWGDTVNTASRMESTGEPGRIQVSSQFAEQLQLLRSVADKEQLATANSNSQPQLRERGEVNVKGKGTMTTYWLEPARA